MMNVERRMMKGKGDRENTSAFDIGNSIFIIQKECQMMNTERRMMKGKGDRENTSAFDIGNSIFSIQKNIE